MKKIVGIDIGGSSVKLAYFAGSTLKKAAMAPLPDNMVADGRILSMDAMADFLRQAARDNGIPLTNAAVAEALDGLPAYKMHCSVLAEEAIKAALADYYRRQGREVPEALRLPCEDEEHGCCSCGH